MSFLGTTKRNVTVHWAKFLYWKVGKGIILKIIMSSKLGGALKHCLCSSPFGGNDPTWLIFFQVGWNHPPEKEGVILRFFFLRCFFCNFQGHVGLTARYSSSPRAVLMVSLLASNEFSFWKLMVWVRMKVPQIVGGRGQNMGLLGQRFSRQGS